MGFIRHLESLPIRKKIKSKRSFKISLEIVSPYHVICPFPMLFYT